MHPAFVSLAATLLLRAQWLVVVLPMALAFGELIARGSLMNLLAGRINQRIALLGQRLDRQRRSAATRVYRGIIALFILLIPAVLAGYALATPSPLAEGVCLLTLIALLGRSLATFHLARLARQAATGSLKLELPGLDYLFPDTHAVMRYLILTSAQDFAVGVVGSCLAYLVGGTTLLLPYLALAAAHRHYTSLAFGWAIRSVFQLLNVIPHRVAVLLLGLAGVFVARGHPLAATKAKHFHGVIAYLLGISLGGKQPGGADLPWEGTGTARILPSHLLGWVLLRMVATVLLMLLLAGPFIYNLLK